MIIGTNLSYCNVYKIYKLSHIKSKSKKVFWFLPLFLFVSLFSLFFFCLFFGQKFFRWLTPFLSILFCFERKHFTVLEKKNQLQVIIFQKKLFWKFLASPTQITNHEFCIEFLLRNDSQAVSEDCFLVLFWLWINGNWCRFKTRCVFINRYSVITDWTKWTGNTYPWKFDVINVLSTGILQMEEVHLLAYRKYLSCL